MLLGTWKKYLYLPFITRGVIKVMCSLNQVKSFDSWAGGKILTFITVKYKSAHSSFPLNKAWGERNDPPIPGIIQEHPGVLGFVPAHGGDDF